MSTDAVSALVSFADNVFSSGVNFVVVIGGLCAVLGAVGVLSRSPGWPSRCRATTAAAR